MRPPDAPSTDAVRPSVNSGDVFGVPEVLRELAGEIEHGRGGTGLAQWEPPHRGAVVLAHGGVGDLPAGRLGEKPDGRLIPGPHPVLPDDACGEGMVRRDGGLTGQLRVVAQQLFGPAQVEADAMGQLAGGLASKREPEHLIGAYVRVRDQPDHPQRHQLGLARPRARDHQQRLVGRRADHLQLLGAELVRDA